jgi:hypothetical protein
VWGLYGRVPTQRWAATAYKGIRETTNGITVDMENAPVTPPKPRRLTRSKNISIDEGSGSNKENCPPKLRRRRSSKSLPVAEDEMGLACRDPEVAMALEKFFAVREMERLAIRRSLTETTLVQREALDAATSAYLI